MARLLTCALRLQVRSRAMPDSPRRTTTTTHLTTFVHDRSRPLTLPSLHPRPVSRALPPNTRDLRPASFASCIPTTARSFRLSLCRCLPLLPFFPGRSLSPITFVRPPSYVIPMSTLCSRRSALSTFNDEGLLSLELIYGRSSST